MRITILPRVALLLAWAGISWSQTTAAYITQLVLPGTGNDATARTQIRRFSNTTFRPGAETERASQELALLNGIQQRTEWQLRSHLMLESQIQGKSASVIPLSAYLKDTNLCEPATQALLGIATTEGPQSVLSNVRTAMLSTTSKCQVTLMRAASSLGDRDSATISLFLQNALSSNRDTRDVALRGLANSGDPRGSTALATARSSTNAFDRYRAIDLSLLYALRLAQRGDKPAGLTLANAIKSASASVTKEQHVVTNADTTINRIGKVVPIHAHPLGHRQNFSLLGRSEGTLKMDVGAVGPFRLRVMNIRGETLHEMKGIGPGAFDISVQNRQGGMTFLLWEGQSERYSLPLAWF